MLFKLYLVIFVLSLSSLNLVEAQNSRSAWVKKYVNKYKPHKEVTTLSPQDIDILITAARKLLTTTKRYDPSYFSLKYPSGDVPKDLGVCTDIIIRSLRSLNIDLQKRVYLDRKQNPKRYPKIWAKHVIDKNIDHRRVPNLMIYMDNYFQKLPLNNLFKAGDIVAYDLGGGITHIGLVSNKKNSKNQALLIHHIGGTPQEEDVLKDWTIIGHYRIKKSRTNL